MIKKQYLFICNNCPNEYQIPFSNSVQSVALARTVIAAKGWKFRGANFDVCPKCAKIEYRNMPSQRKRERNLSITILYIRGTSMPKLAKRHGLSVERISKLIEIEINRKRTELSQIPGFTDSQESSFLKRCLQFKEKTISILRR